MKTSYLIIAVATLLWTGCRPSSDIIPTPVPTTTPAANTKSIKVVHKPLSVYDNLTIKNGERDTLYFNEKRWAHRPNVERFIALGDSPDMGRYFTVIYDARGQGWDYDWLNITLRSRTGMQRGSDLLGRLSPYYIVGNRDSINQYYTLDRSKDNWINITKIDEGVKTIKATFSLHFLIEGISQTYLGDMEMPNTIHMSGIINE